jgi:gluconolactonase
MPFRISRDILKLVRLRFQLVAAACLCAPLGAVDRLHPVEVARFHTFAGGVALDASGNAYVSHGSVISRISPDGKRSVWAETGAPGGHKILPDGTHLVCDSSRHDVLRLDAQGKILGSAITVPDGKRLKSPNDLTLDPAGGFYFTDSGGMHGDAPGSIHYVDAAGRAQVAARGLHYPNGIVLRADARTLLVSESPLNRIVSFEVTAPGKLGPMKVFATLPGKQKDQIDNRPDGMCLDHHGNLFIAHYGMRMVAVLSRTGRLIRQFPAGVLTPSDVAFGGPKMDQLFITGAVGAEENSEGALVRLDVRMKGQPWPVRPAP